MESARIFLYPCKITYGIAGHDLQEVPHQQDGCNGCFCSIATDAFVVLQLVLLQCCNGCFCNVATDAFATAATDAFATAATDAFATAATGAFATAATDAFAALD